MPHSRRFAAHLCALTLVFASVAVHAQDVAPAGPVAPVVLSVPPLDKDNCPADYPVKGNKRGRQAERPADPIYHVPGSRWYPATDPEECFATAEDAELAGYRAPLR